MLSRKPNDSLIVRSRETDRKVFTEEVRFRYIRLYDFRPDVCYKSFNGVVTENRSTSTVAIEYPVQFTKSKFQPKETWLKEDPSTDRHQGF